METKENNWDELLKIVDKISKEIIRRENIINIYRKKIEELHNEFYWESDKKLLELFSSARKKFLESVELPADEKKLHDLIKKVLENVSGSKKKFETMETIERKNLIEALKAFRVGEGINNVKMHFYRIEGLGILLE